MFVVRRFSAVGRTELRTQLKLLTTSQGVLAFQMDVQFAQALVLHHPLPDEADLQFV